MSYELPAMGDEVPVTVAGVYERAQNPWMRSGRRTMFLTLEDAYGLFECVVFESKLARYAPGAGGGGGSGAAGGAALTSGRRPARLGQIVERPTLAEHKILVAERKQARVG